MHHRLRRALIVCQRSNDQIGRSAAKRHVRRPRFSSKRRRATATDRDGASCPVVSGIKVVVAAADACSKGPYIDGPAGELSRDTNQRTSPTVPRTALLRRQRRTVAHSGRPNRTCHRTGRPHRLPRRIPDCRNAAADQVRIRRVSEPPVVRSTQARFGEFNLQVFPLPVRWTDAIRRLFVHRPVTPNTVRSDHG